MSSRRALWTASVVALAATLAGPAAAAEPWQAPVDVSQSCCGAYNPFALQGPDGAHHLWWVQAEPGEDARWFPMYTRDVGGSFAPATAIAGELDARVIDVAAGGEPLALHAVISGFRVAYGMGCAAGQTGGCSDLTFVESLDGGATWSPAQVLPHADDALQRYEPVIVRDAAGELTIAADVGGAIMTRTRPSGGVWGPEAPVSGQYAGQQHAPRLAVTRGALHLLYRAKPDDGPGDLLMYARREGGAWTAPASISPIVGGAILSSIVTDGAARLQVAFQSSGEGEYTIYYTESQDGGAGWSPPVALTVGYAARPIAARELGGQTLHVVWDTGEAIRHAESSGQGFAPDELLSGALNKSLEPHVAAGPKDISAAWHARPAEGMPYNIYFTTRAPTDALPEDPTGEPGSSGGDDGGESSGAESMSSGTGTPTTGAGEDPTGGATTGGATTGGGATTASEAPGGEGCGCRSAPGPWWLAIVALARRRRQGRAQ